MKLTEKEIEIINLTADLFNKCCELPVIHPSDMQETERDIHNIQNRIMARSVAIRISTNDLKNDGKNK